MKEQLEINYHNITDRHIELFKKITHRGPKSFNQLLYLCIDNFPEAAYVLATNDNNIPNIN